MAKKNEKKNETEAVQVVETEAVQVVETEAVQVVPPSTVSATLLAHCGGWETDRAELAKVPTPAARRRWAPVGHADFIDGVERAADEIGLAIASQRYALAREGDQLFGVMTLRGNGLIIRPDAQLAVLMRNSLDKSLSLLVGAGSHVFACDNLAVHSEFEILNHKHRPEYTGDMEKIVAAIAIGLQNALAAQSEIFSFIDLLKAKPCDDRTAAYQLLELSQIDNGTPNQPLPATAIQDVWQAWRNPIETQEEENLFRLWSAYTGTAKDRFKPWAQWTRTMAANQFFMNLAKA